MALVVYDQGYRIQTPVSALFKPRGTEQTTELRSSGGLPGSDDIAHGEAHELEQAFLNNSRQPLQRRLPTGERGEGRSSGTYENVKFSGAERRKHGLTAQQLMVSPVYTARPEESLRRIAEQMLNYKVHHIVVTDDNQRPLGIVSDNDILAHGSDSPMPASEVYQSQIVVAAPDTELSILAATFVNYPIRAIPVIDEREQVVGIITRSDLLRLLINNARVESWA
ncbi:MAG: CBS domain-containing protein [Oceanospirillaceae bacterium]|jgi:CBS domain-containing protein|uniref:CBS domain-containing protein n=1 Tax=Marinobacterium litorale TaxID=404770 RepID=UPI0003FE73A6|nr:CBS domain-containing protein [Marinobacterium litorale]MBT00252.1 CBS domain-containing protein [Oceanospirillaceae bacterium]